MLKTLLQLGQGLVSAREMRDIFIDIHEKFLESFEEVNVTGHQLFQVLEAIRECFSKLTTIKPQHVQKYNSTFSQFMIVIRDLSVYMYKKLLH